MSDDEFIKSYDEIERQIEELQADWKYPSNALKAKFAFDKGDIGQACFHLGQYFEIYNRVTEAITFYYTGAKIYSHAGCQAEFVRLEDPAPSMFYIITLIILALLS